MTNLKSIDAAERSRIVTILYHEVIQATREMKETRDDPEGRHRQAKDALQRAVTRYTDFTLDGRVPKDLHFRDVSA